MFGNTTSAAHSGITGGRSGTSFVAVIDPSASFDQAARMCRRDASPTDLIRQLQAVADFSNIGPEFVEPVDETAANGLVVLAS